MDKGYIRFIEEESQMVNKPIKQKLSILLRVNGETHINITQCHFSVIRLTKVLKIYNTEQRQGFGRV